MLDQLLKPEIQELIEDRDLRGLRQVLSDWEPAEVGALIDTLPAQDDIVVFRILPRDLATDTFEYLSSDKQQELLEALAQKQHRLSELLNGLSPDDRTALFEELPGHVTQRLLTLLSPEEHRIAVALLGYPEESLGRLMTPEYVAVDSTWSVRDALDHIRRYGKDSETLNVIYVVDRAGRLVDDLRIRELLLVDPATPIAELMDERFVSLKATDDQETAIRLFRDYDRVALPVTDTRGVLVGIVTIDDVLDVAEAEATEDIQMIGGSEALDEPYLETPLHTLVRKRARWLILLFLGEMLTIEALKGFQTELDRIVTLSLFLPLIVSGGGNSGSQAATLVIRALAVGEVKLSDWGRVMRREILSGVMLGVILACVGLLRIGIGQLVGDEFGPIWSGLAGTIGFAVLFVVLWGTFTGSMLPLLMKRLGIDPAASSTPFVATLVDVTGVLIYLSMALLFLGDALR